jgi:ElaB/YqjD/DUF883 family membrane-anchored ribosome-binding protein
MSPSSRFQKVGEGLQGERPMDNEDAIRDQMEDTRTSLTDKLETLEKQVAHTVSDATTNVAETVEAVKETVQETVTSVKDSVQETISAVKESMHQGVEAVRGFFDIPHHVDHHPWAMIGGAVAVGYVVGSALGRSAPSRRETSGARPYQQPPPTARAHSNGRSEAATPEPSPGLLSSFGPEIAKLKTLALGSLMGAVRDMIHNAVPPDLGSSLDGILKSVSEKITGAAARSPKEQHSSYPSHREAVVGD